MWAEPLILEELEEGMYTSSCSKGVGGKKCNILHTEPFCGSSASFEQETEAGF